MKTIITLERLMLLAGSLLIFNIAAFAQEDPDTTKKKILIDAGDRTIEMRIVLKDSAALADTVHKKDKKKDKREMRKFWSGIDFGFNGYLNKENQADMPVGFERFDYNIGKSTYFGFNLWEKGIPLYKNNAALVTGVGIDYNNYRFKSNSYVFGTPDSTGVYPEKDYSTNRLKVFYVTVPLMLGFDFGTSHPQSVHIAFGVVGGIKFSSYTKEKYTEDGSNVKERTYNDFDLNAFKLNATARAGYGNFTLFANYSLTPLFNNAASNPELYPFAIGITLIGG